MPQFNSILDLLNNTFEDELNDVKEHDQITKQIKVYINKFKGK